MKKIPVVRREYLSDNSFVQKIIGSTLPGSKKLQFPFEIPTIQTNNAVEIPSGTGAILIGTASVFAAGMIISALIKRSN